MAVQAQYPSNFLIGSNARRANNDSSLQPSQSDLHNTPMHFDIDRIINNPRKRGREFDIASTIADTIPTNPHLFSSEFDTSLHLSFGDQKQFQSSQSVNSFSIMAQQLSRGDIEQHCEELHRLLQSQGERLWRKLAEQRRRRYDALLQAAEDFAAPRLREKEAELEKAARLNSELEARAAQLNAEVQTWRARTREQEITAAMLQAQLQQAMKGRSAKQGRNELGCDAADDAESAYIDPDRVVASTGPSCQGCRRRDASVVVLPCRHFCLCRECDSVAQICPICYSYRSSSVEALLS